MRHAGKSVFQRNYILDLTGFHGLVNTVVSIATGSIASIFVTAIAVFSLSKGDPDSMEPGVKFGLFLLLAVILSIGIYMYINREYPYS